jgi:hypothetical protein
LFTNRLRLHAVDFLSASTLAHLAFMSKSRSWRHTIRRCCSGVNGPRGSWPAVAAGRGGVAGL